MFKNSTIIALAMVALSSCAVLPKSAEAEFESLIQTNGYYYSEGNISGRKALEAQLTEHSMSTDRLDSILGEQHYYILTFDDLSSNELTSITLSSPVVEGRIPEHAITSKISSKYSVRRTGNGGYSIRFSDYNGNLRRSFVLRANSRGEIRNYSFIAQ
ncbi:hypothetical protein [Aliidiomarina soli]|uniref:Lipoprotein n=1 Tax=Aliidiomarina soli TaxID=1928574 RepID=A0A432WBX1_9GAMM|nr:hypothetical protein [Aliidiomarina soli]RUO29574.1 hypothetical protein CWE14_14030 [Aliidiomarina soli]